MTVWRPPAFGVGRNDLLTTSQLNAIYLVGRERGFTEDGIDDAAVKAYGRVPKDMSKGEASRFIGVLRVATPQLIEAREATRQHLRASGFQMVRSTVDNGDGQTGEWWRHPDGSTLKLNWSKRRRGVE